MAEGEGFEPPEALPPQRFSRPSSLRSDVGARAECDGRTWVEHAHEGGECCQSKGNQLEDPPAEGQRAAQERLAQAK
jgi:hypothetical protein